MAKYYGQVAELDADMRKFIHTQNSQQDLLKLVAKRFNIDNEIVTYNSIANVLTTCLEGKELNSVIDFMETKQDELGKKRLNMSSIKLEDHLELSKRVLSKPMGFYKCPQKTRVEAIPNFEQIQLMIKQSGSEMKSSHGSPTRKKSRRGGRGSGSRDSRNLYSKPATAEK